VLGFERDDVIARRGRRVLAGEMRGALDRQIVGLGGAAGENHLIGPGANQRGDLLAGVFHQGARGAPLGMDR